MAERDYGADIEEQKAILAKHGLPPWRIFVDLGANLARAAMRHPAPHNSTMETRGVISAETYELDEAMHSRDTTRVRAELIDIATAALRGVEALDAREGRG